MLTRQSKRKRHSDDIGVDTKDFTRSREHGGLLANKPVHSRASVGDDGDAARVQLIESIREQWPDCLAPRCRRIRSLYSPEVDKKLRARGGEARRLMPGRADEKGYLIIVSGQMLTSRYRIMGAIGKGTFSKVVECVDMETETDVAVKIVRNIEKYTKASMNEIMIIMTMMQYDPTGLFDFVRLSNWFVYPHGGHVTMVFPKLGPSLYETMNRNDDRPFPVYMIRKYLKRLCQTLAFMHSIGIVHTDVKPENILHDNVRYEEVTSEHPGLASEFPKSDTLTLIDFGSAQFIERSHQKLVSTRHYRAPEVLLGLPWSLSIDVWSVGCVLLEFVVGSTLFCNHDVRAAPEDKDMEQLGMIERALGRIPPALAQRCEPHTKTYEDVFRPNGTLRYPTSTTTSTSRRWCMGIQKLEDYFCSDVNPSLRENSKDTRKLLDLARKMLQWLPEKRCTFVEALEHPFFTQD